MLHVYDQKSKKNELFDKYYIKPTTRVYLGSKLFECNGLDKCTLEEIIIDSAYTATFSVNFSNQANKQNNNKEALGSRTF